MDTAPLSQTVTSLRVSNLDVPKEPGGGYKEPGGTRFVTVDLEASKELDEPFIVCLIL